MPYVTESNITKIVLDRWNAVPNPRLRQIVQSMIRHLHAFARDVERQAQSMLGGMRLDGARGVFPIVAMTAQRLVGEYDTVVGDLRQPVPEQHLNAQFVQCGGDHLARAGSELVRITVDRDEAAAAVPHIRDRLAQMGVAVPLIGDFNDWDPAAYPMKRQPDGNWLIQVPLHHGHHHYQRPRHAAGQESSARARLDLCKADCRHHR